MELHVLNHPLVEHKVRLLRDVNTNSATFRALVEELVMLLAYEATREVRVEQIEVQTPITTTTGVRLSQPRPLVVPILRAGLGMLPGVLALIPTARVSVVGLQRDEETLQPVPYFERLTGRLEERDALILDPMLATGNSAIAAVDRIKEVGPRSIKFVCLLAAHEGVAALQAAHPDVPIYTAAVDRQLNEHGYILPGLGDAGDRIFGTK